MRACHDAQVPVGGARLGQRAVRRGAAGRGRRADRADAAAADPRGRPAQPARRLRAGRHEHRDLAGRRAEPLLPARPVEPDRLLDRRQRRRELGRRALLQVRLHDQLRLRPGGRAQRRLGRRARRQGARRSRLRPARRVRRLGGHARHRDADHRARRARAGVGAHARRLLRDDRRAPATRCRRSSARASCPGRSR